MPIESFRAGAGPGVVALAAAFALACGPFQTYSQGVQAICDAPTTCPDCDDPRPSEREDQLRTYISSTVGNRKAIAMYYKPVDRRANQNAARAESLAKEAKDAGVTPCALADALTSEARLLDDGMQPALPAINQCGTSMTPND